MRIRTFKPIAGSSLLLLASAVSAQTSTPPAADDSSVFSVEEIIVTARRRAESLQDVPQTVDAVTSEEIERLNLQRFEDLQTIIPGLTLSSGSTGFTTAATVRGASFQVESSASPTVEFYLNDAPIQSVFLFQQMYDVGQVELLRGPQGTLRGRASPSGSLTVTTRRPDLTEFGSNIYTLATDEDALMVQGAVNIPLVEDKLALRVAGIFDENDYDHVRSLTVDRNPSSRTKSGRVSLRWEASDALSTNLVYQYLERDLFSFDAYQSLSVSQPGAPVVLPTLRAEDRRSILEAGRDNTQELDILTANVDYRIGGQKVSYVGSYSNLDLIVRATPMDIANVVPNFEFFNSQVTGATSRAHELRLSSEERLFGVFDYTVGAFFQDFTSPSDLKQQTLIAIPTGPMSLAVPVPPALTLVGRRSGTEETSLFTNLTYHLGDKTELSAGVRYIEFDSDSSLVVNGATLSDISTTETPVVWNVAGSYRFTDDFLLYGNVGTSFRDGPLAVGVFRPLTPRLTQFLDLDSEDSTSYEVGFKADFLDKKLRLNVSAFYQDFKDYIYRGPSVSYVNLGRTGAVPALFNFVANVDATVKGGEVDLAYQPIKDLNLSLTYAYAKGEIDNGVVACNDFDRNGVPDRTVPAAPSIAQILAAAGSTSPLTEAVAACTVNDRLSFAPDWSATLQADYTVPVTAKMDAFGRALYSYYTDNEQDPNNIFDDVDAYGLLNLYGGVRSNNGSWEVSLFVRNVLDKEEVLNSSNGPTATPFTNAMTGVGSSLAGSFLTTTFTPPREIGLSLRYAFGSR